MHLHLLTTMKYEARLIEFKIVKFKNFLVERIIWIITFFSIFDNYSAPHTFKPLLNLVVRWHFLWQFLNWIFWNVVCQLQIWKICIWTWFFFTNFAINAHMILIFDPWHHLNLLGLLFLLLHIIKKIKLLLVWFHARFSWLFKMESVTHHGF